MATGWTTRSRCGWPGRRGHGTHTNSGGQDLRQACPGTADGCSYSRPSSLSIRNSCVGELLWETEGLSGRSCHSLPVSTTSWRGPATCRSSLHATRTESRPAREHPCADLADDPRLLPIFIREAFSWCVATTSVLLLAPALDGGQRWRRRHLPSCFGLPARTNSREACECLCPSLADDPRLLAFCFHRVGSVISRSEGDLVDGATEHVKWSCRAGRSEWMGCRAGRGLMRLARGCKPGQPLGFDYPASRRLRVHRFATALAVMLCLGYIFFRLLVGARGWRPHQCSCRR